MEKYAWYTSASSDTPITQGDIVFKCPVPIIDVKREYPFFTVKGNHFDVIVVTQACDLEQQKVNEVTLCPIEGLSSVVKGLMDKEFQEKDGYDYLSLTNKERKKKEQFITEIKKGSYRDLHLLNKNYEIPDVDLSYSVVILKQKFTMPVDSLQEIVSERSGKRLSLLPPYREHLAQAYASNYDRIGLPVPIEVDLEEI